MRRAARVAVLLPALAVAAPPEPFAPRVHAAAGASIDRGGVSVGAGARWAPWPRVGVGLELEYNPWFDLLSVTWAPGVVALVGAGFVRWAELDGVELRSTLHLGASALLFDAFGAPRGAVGGYVGLSALNAVFRVAPGMWIEVKPDVAVPVPQLRGSPFAYRQYRMTVGLEWAPR